MMQEQLFKNIFRKEENDNGNASLLSAVTEQYPYFGAAQFYLLKNTAAGNPAFDLTAARTALFFNDPFLLNQQLKKPSPVYAAAPEIHEEIPVAAVEPQPSFDKEVIPVPEEIKPEPANEAEPKKEEMLFEPLHATDYFASQGIKLSENVLPNDKLGMQLKSFTSWLKTMKKAHPEKMGTGMAVNDAAIQNLAEKSNVEEDIVTEAMAEAYVQQGKAEKAREIWQKLSLQNPAKSAYFAAKIESLKQ